MNEPSGEPQVLIVGAGPTGLVLALWLTWLGARVRIIDKTAEPGTTSRALAVQARTLELYRQTGLAKAVVENGRLIRAVNLWVAGRRKAHAVFGEMGAGLSPFPYALIFPQDEHERLLIERLAELGVGVERRTELLDFEARAGRIDARLRRPDGRVESCECGYLAGCDGAHSTVRNALRVGFAGGTYEHLFYVADVAASGTAMDGEIHVALDRSDFLAVFPLKAEGHARLVGTIRDDKAEPRDQLDWQDVGKRVIEWLRLDVQRVNWFSNYRVHHRVAERFRQGQAFLLGDAAHIHSPVGGQGMNTGIGDAVNLAWKLAAVLQGRAKPSILDTYEPERIAFARRLVATTDRAFTGVSSSGVLARWVRLDLVPLLLPALFRLRPMRRFLFRTVSQAAVNYRGSELSTGRAGAVRGGDRLPWAKVAGNSGDADNFTPLASLDWQMHVYGAAAPELRAACAGRRLPLHVFAWEPALAGIGFRRDAAYLLRPDGYVALADAAGSADAAISYLERHGIVPRRQEGGRRQPMRSTAGE